MNAQPISEKSRASGCGTVALFLFGLIFFLAGCVSLFSAFLLPLSQSIKAKYWVPTACTIVRSSVEAHSNSDGDDSYSPEIEYQYNYSGRDYKSSRYSFHKFSSGRRWANRIVEQYPVGGKATCYCDPRNPETAVLERGFRGAAFWFGLLFPWPFILVGAGIVYFSIGGNPWSSKKGREPAASSDLKGDPGSTGHDSQAKINPRDTNPKTSDDELEEPEMIDASDYSEFEGPRKLRPAQSRIGNAIAIGIFALLWNGIIGFIAFSALGDRSSFWPLLIVTPFALAGIGLIFLFFYMLLSLTNPKVEIALSNGAVGLGDSIDVAWQTFGKISRIREFSICVEGQEEATYTRGTSTYTDKAIFCKIELARHSTPAEIEFGTVVLNIPANTMHSFEASRNKIRWHVVVRGNIPRWPDVNESYEFKVTPGKSA